MKQKIEVPIEYWMLNQSGLSVITDPAGGILEVIQGPSGTGFTFNFLRRLLLSKKNIHRVFDIPGTARHAPLSASPGETGDGPVFGNRPGLVDFRDEQEEFHSAIPLAYLNLYRLPKGLLFGRVRLASFFPRIAENFESAIFCTDEQERLTGFNWQFFMLFNDKNKKPRAMLNRHIGDFLDPGPGQIQKSELEKIRTADGRGYRLRFRADTPQAIKKISVEKNEMGGFLVLPVPIQWMKEDVMVRISLEPGAHLPGLIFGDLPEGYRFPDRNGYLIGPGFESRGVVIKKRGRMLFGRKPDRELTPGGEYTYVRTRNAFRLDRGEDTLIAFADFNSIPRERTRVLLFQRPGREFGLARIEVLTRNKDTAGLSNNIFTAHKNDPGKHYLLEYLYHFSLSLSESHYTVFKLQDLSDVKTRLESLERMSRLLKSYQDEQGAFVGSGKAIALIREKAEKIAGSSASVLIQGQTGTGKEVLARFIHAGSAFRDGPFVKVDCSTLPPTLMESMLFGHEKGAFTGADAARQGLFEQAQGGTLFLDEIGNLSLDVQAKLLHFMQDRTFTPVGGTRTVKLDLRILVASNVLLEAAVKNGTFREDLYYRIAVIVLNLPELRERPEDIPELANHFLAAFNRKNRKNIRGLSAAAYRKIYGYAWPGNIRELRNAVERACVFCEGDLITGDHLVLAGEGAAPGEKAKGARKPHATILKSRSEVVEMFGRLGMVKRLAEELGVSRKTVYNYFEKHGIRVRRPR